MIWKYLNIHSSFFVIKKESVHANIPLIGIFEKKLGCAFA